MRCSVMTGVRESYNSELRGGIVLRVVVYRSDISKTTTVMSW